VRAVASKQAFAQLIMQRTSQMQQQSIIAASGETYTVPTLAVIQQILKVGESAGLAERSRRKANGALDSMLAAIESCNRAGVKVGLGTDIFGTEFHDLQSNRVSLSL